MLMESIVTKFSFDGVCSVILRILNDVFDFSRLEAGTLHLDDVSFDLHHVSRLLQVLFEVEDGSLRDGWRKFYALVCLSRACFDRILRCSMSAARWLAATAT